MKLNKLKIILAAQAGCHFDLYLKIQRNRGGKVRRFLKLVEATTKEQTGFIEISGEELATPAKFRVWCLNRGNFVFSGGFQQLTALNLKLAGIPIAESQRKKDKNGTYVLDRSGNYVPS